ncbi:hypothetical protein Tco_1165454 [Tanacetum coccineum]
MEPFINPPYQPPTNQPLVNQALPPVSQIQGVSKTDFDNYVKANDAVLKNVQNQGQNLQNQMANVTILLTSLCHNFKNCRYFESGIFQVNTAITPREQINEPEQNPETLTEKVQKPSSESTAQVPPSEDQDSIFMEIPKPKAKITVNVEIQDLNSLRLCRINLNFHIRGWITHECLFIRKTFPSTAQKLFIDLYERRKKPLTFKSYGGKRKELVYSYCEKSENLRENISSGTLLFLKEPLSPRPPPEPPDVEKCLEPEAVKTTILDLAIITFLCLILRAPGGIFNEGLLF